LLWKVKDPSHVNGPIHTTILTRIYGLTLLLLLFTSSLDGPDTMWDSIYKGYTFSPVISKLLCSVTYQIVYTVR